MSDKKVLNEKFSEETKKRVEEYVKTNKVDRIVLDAVTAVTGFEFDDYIEDDD